MNVAVIGASNDPEKYSYKAVKLLQEKGHTVFPVHPTLKDIEGTPVYSSVKLVPQKMDTVTVYLNPKVSSSISDEIIAIAPRRIIFNPGAENPEFEQKAKSRGIETLEACTLVLLKTRQF